jgi:hypothetical protein
LRLATMSLHAREYSLPSRLLPFAVLSSQSKMSLRR